MTNKELAEICATTECRFCKQEVKQECLKNKCWKEPIIQNRKCPAVYYGVLPRSDTKQEVEL